MITRLEPSLPAERIAAATWRAQPAPAKLRRLAWAIEDTPGLLTGDGAHAPMPAVLRLIDELCNAGAQAITRPACPRCGRVIRLDQRIDGQWLCRNCVARSRAQPCSRCRAVREAATRDEHGRPLCSNCLVTDPANQEACVTCGRRRRSAPGPRTGRCAILAGRGRSRPATSARNRRRARSPRSPASPGAGPAQSAGPGALAAARPARSAAAPVTSPSARPAPSQARARGAAAPAAGSRAACTPDDAPAAPQQRLHDLLADEHGQIPAGLQATYQALAAVKRPATVASWLNSSSASDAASGH